MATDVLSFPQYERDDDLTREMPLLYGDVVISLEHARAQAESYNHSLKRELSYLFVHSLLHLRGYDHMIESDKKEYAKAVVEIAMHSIGKSDLPNDVNAKLMENRTYDVRQIPRVK